MYKITIDNDFNTTFETKNFEEIETYLEIHNFTNEIVWVNIDGNPAIELTEIYNFIF